MADRRELFRKLFSKEEEKTTPLPPYYKNISDFEKCEDCSECAKVCEESIIVIEDNKPILDFSKSGCTFCDECAEVCPKDVLKKEYKRVINVIMEIDILKCLAWNQTMCRFCLDVCDERAVKFLGLFRPEIITDVCTGCGFCVGVCPTDAIKINKRKEKEEI